MGKNACEWTRRVDISKEEIPGLGAFVLATDKGLGYEDNGHKKEKAKKKRRKKRKKTYLLLLGHFPTLRLSAD